MARIHILTGSTGGVYTAVVHTATPAGNNVANVLWSDALKNSGRAVTVMTVGNGAGQISQAEANQIAAGTLIEGVFQWGDNAAWSNAERQADLNIRANQLIAEMLAQYQMELRLFGAALV
jgi:hypothetical protein